MAESELLISEVDSVIHVTFNRPDKYNAINLAMWEGLHRATAMLRDRDDLSAMLVTANGRYFSAGIDLHSPLAPDPAVTSPSRFRRWYRQGVGSLHQLGDEWEAVEKPRSEEHTSELQSLMRTSYAVLCLKKKNKVINTHTIRDVTANDI